MTANGWTAYQGVDSPDVVTYAGDNTINAAGVDVPMTIFGGSGSDTIYGGAGFDTIDVSSGQNNWVQAGAGGANITGGNGNDWLYAGNGGGSTYYIYGGPGQR